MKDHYCPICAMRHHPSANVSVKELYRETLNVMPAYLREISVDLVMHGRPRSRLVMPFDGAEVDYPNNVPLGDPMVRASIVLAIRTEGC